MTSQPSLLEWQPPAVIFGDRDGESFDRDRDGPRLDTLAGRVWKAMADGQWHTLDELVETCGGTTASVSARCRDFRKSSFGGAVVERRFVRNGIFEYRLLAGEAR